MCLGQIAKYLIIGGIILSLLGGLLWIMSKAGISIGNLPGDIHLQSGKGSFSFPVVTCIFLSVALTIVINVVLWILRK